MWIWNSSSMTDLYIRQLVSACSIAEVIAGLVREDIDNLGTQCWNRPSDSKLRKINAFLATDSDPIRDLLYEARNNSRGQDPVPKIGDLDMNRFPLRILCFGRLTRKGSGPTAALRMGLRSGFRCRRPFQGWLWPSTEKPSFKQLNRRCKSFS